MTFLTADFAPTTAQALYGRRVTAFTEEGVSVTGTLADHPTFGLVVALDPSTTPVSLEGVTVVTEEP